MSAWLLRYGASVPAAAVSFYADPYSSYQTRLVSSDGTDQAGGASLTKTWGGVTGTFAVYATLQYALNDYLTTGGRRIGLVGGQTYVMSANLVFPNSGSSDTSRVVLQSDPASATQAIIDLNTTTTITVDVQYLTIRKLEIKNSVKTTGDGNPVSGGIFCGQSGSYTGCIVEWCNIHDITAESGAFNTGGVAFSHSGGFSNSTGNIVRYCKFSNIYITGGSFNLNFAGVYTASIRAQVLNCTFDNTCTGVFEKYSYDQSLGNFGSSNPNGTIIRYCIFKNMGTTSGIAFHLDEAGTNSLYNMYGPEFTNNLVYNTANALQVLPGDGRLVQYSKFVFKNNTIAEDALIGVYIGGYDDIQVSNNAFLCTQFQFALTDPPPTYHNVISLCDYNGYGGAGQWELKYAHGDSYATSANLTAWKSFFTNTASSACPFNPDSHGVAITTSSFNSTATRDYSPKVGSALISAGSDGRHIGCYDATSTAASTLVGAGW